MLEKKVATGLLEREVREEEEKLMSGREKEEILERVVNVETETETDTET